MKENKYLERDMKYKQKCSLYKVIQAKAAKQK